MGKRAQIELVDESSGGWGHINFDALEFTGAAGEPEEPEAGSAAEH